MLAASLRLLQLDEAVRVNEPTLLRGALEQLKNDPDPVLRETADLFPPSVLEGGIVWPSELRLRFPALAVQARRAEIAPEESGVGWSLVAAAVGKIETAPKGELVEGSGVNEVCSRTQYYMERRDYAAAYREAQQLAQHQNQQVRSVAQDWVADLGAFLRVEQTLQLLHLHLIETARS